MGLGICLHVYIGPREIDDRNQLNIFMTGYQLKLPWADTSSRTIMHGVSIIFVDHWIVPQGSSVFHLTANGLRLESNVFHTLCTSLG